MTPKFWLGFSDLYCVPDVPVMISINRLLRRKSDFSVGEWVMDSGAFTSILAEGEHRLPARDYVAQIERWKVCGELLWAASQDYMCEPFILEKWGRTVAQHQRMTIDRYDQIMAEKPSVYILPVLQGYDAQDYVRHIRDYGERLKPGMLVGVGSVCKRNSDILEISKVLYAIKRGWPDLRLHGFGVKTTALKNPLICEMLDSADSMAWSYNARRNGLNKHCPEVAKQWRAKIIDFPMQSDLFGVQT